MNIEDCIEKGYLIRVSFDKKLVQKEFDEANYDLEKAKDTLEENDFKWSIIKAYYSIFHAARAVLFSVGLREKRHFVIGIVLEKLSRKGKLQYKFVNDFRGAMAAREDADYRYVHNKDTAEYLVEIAEEFCRKMRELSEKLKPHD